MNKNLKSDPDTKAGVENAEIGTIIIVDSTERYTKTKNNEKPWIAVCTGKIKYITNDQLIDILTQIEHLRTASCGMVSYQVISPKTLTGTPNEM